MGTSLTGVNISQSYLGLLKSTDSQAISSTVKRITDGNGNDLPLSISTSTVRLQAGTSTAPSLSFGSNSEGFYVPSDENVGFVIAGSEKIRLNSDGLSILNSKITLNNDQKIRWSSDDVYIQGTTATDNIQIGLAGSTKLTLHQTTGLTLAQYGSGSITGTVTQRLGVTSSGQVVEIPIGGGAVDGSGTAGKIVKWSDSDTITDSIMAESGSTITMSGGADTILQVVGTTTSARLDLQTNSHHRFWQTIESDGRFRLYNQTTGSEQFTVLSDGKTGIGTSSPDRILHIESDSVAAIQLENTSEADSFVDFKNPSRNFRVGYDDSADLFKIAVTNFSGSSVNIDASANVGIGLTPTVPLDTLAQNGTTDVSSITYNNLVRFRGTDSGGLLFLAKTSDQDQVIQTTNNDADLILGTRTGSNNFDRLHIQGNTGNIGIGTNSPSNEMHISKSQNATTTLQIQNANTGTGARANLHLQSDASRIDLYATSSTYNGVASWTDAGVINTSTTSSGGLILNSQAGGIKFQTSTNERMQLDSSGRLGLGTSAPAYLLSIDDATITNTPKTLLQFNTDNIADNGGYNIDFRTSSNDTADRFVARIQALRGSGASSSLGFFTETGSALTRALLLDSSQNATFSGTLTVEGAGNSAISGDLYLASSKKYISTSSSSGDYIRLYASSGTGKWDIYGSGADLRFTDNDSAGAIRFDTNVGIGATPSEDLHITGDTPVIRFTDSDTSRDAQIVAIDGNLRFDADNNNQQSSTNISFRTDGTERASIDSTGLGIGTTSPSSSLHVFADSSSSNEILFENSGTGDAGLTLRSDDNGNGNTFSFINFDGNDASGNNTRYASIFGQIEDNTAGAEDGQLLLTTLVNNAEVNQLKLNSSGATFAGDISLIQANTPTIELKDTTNNRFLLIRHNNFASIFDVHTDSHYEFQINSSEKMRLDNSGNLGLGTSSPDVAGFPSSTLTIEGSSTNYGAFELGSASQTSADGRLGEIRFYNKESANPYGFASIRGLRGASAGDSHISFFTSASNTGAERMRITSGGLVGIGTTSTGAFRLAVENTSEDLLKLHNSTDGLDSLISFTNPGGTLGRIQGIDNGGLGFDTGNNAGGINTNAMFITNSAKVGIGTSSPEQLFTAVGGSISVSGNTGTNRQILELTTASTVATIKASYQGSSSFGDLAFQTGGSERMRITADGKVGIGDSAPDTKLRVDGDVKVVSSVGGKLHLRSSDTDIVSGDFIGNLYFEGVDAGGASDSVGAVIHAIATDTWTPTVASTKLQVKIRNANTLATALEIAPSKDVTFNGDLAISKDVPALDFVDTNSDDDFRLRNNNGTFEIFDTTNSNTTLSITSSGDIQIPTDSAKLQLRSSGSASYTSINRDSSNNLVVRNTASNSIFALENDGDLVIGGTLTQGSDINLKENIKPLQSQLDIVNKLNPVSYNRIGKKENQIGFIAQEVEKLIPDLVSENPDGLKSLAYANMTSILVKAMQEQQDMIDELKAEIDELKKNK